MKAVWKYTLGTTGRQTIQIPIGAEILTTQLQDKEILLWVLVDPKERREYINIYIYGTGHEIEIEHLEYINTFQEGELVFHVFKEL